MRSDGSVAKTEASIPTAEGSIVPFGKLSSSRSNLHLDAILLAVKVVAENIRYHRFFVEKNLQESPNRS